MTSRSKKQAMTKIKIKRNVGPPPKVAKYPFAELKPGDSFEVEDLTASNALRVTSSRMKKLLKRKFSVHKTGNKITVYRHE